MARPGIGVKPIDIRDKLSTNRIEVNVAYEFFKVPVFLTDDRFIAVLEEVAGACVPSVEADGITGQEPGHYLRQGDFPRAEEQVDMVRKESPCVAPCVAFRKESTASPEKVASICNARKNRAPFDSPDDDVMQDAWSIETRLTGHRGMVSPP